MLNVDVIVSPELHYYFARNLLDLPLLIPYCVQPLSSMLGEIHRQLVPHNHMDGRLFNMGPALPRWRWWQWREELSSLIPPLLSDPLHNHMVMIFLRSHKLRQSVIPD